VKSYGAAQADTRAARARHILIKGDEKEACAKLLGFCDEIGDNASRFASVAVRESEAKDAYKGGYLGIIVPQQLTKAFDDVIFGKDKDGAPLYPQEITLGPVQTTLGWHLLFVEYRGVFPREDNSACLGDRSWWGRGRGGGGGGVGSDARVGVVAGGRGSGGSRGHGSRPGRESVIVTSWSNASSKKSGAEP